MNRTLRLAVLVALVAIAAFGFVRWSSVRPGGDFEQLYAAARGLWFGLSPYDVGGQAQLLAREHDLARPPGLLPFAYPPWYALLAAPLGLLSPAEAGRVFVLWNCGSLVGALLLLTRGRPDGERLFTGLAAGLYLPVLGQIGIGQHTVPVLVGAAVVPAALRSGSIAGAAAGWWLLSLKPHLGLPVAIALAIASWRHPPARRAAGWGVGLLALSAAVSFGVAPGWVVDWPRSVVALSATETLTACDTCCGLPRVVSDQLLGGRGRSLLALGVFGLAGGLALRRGLLSTPERAAAAGCAIAVCGLPYVRNYDGVLVAAPLVLALGASVEPKVRLICALVWVLPVIGLTGRELSGASVGVSAALALVALVSLPPPLIRKVTNA